MKGLQELCRRLSPFVVGTEGNVSIRSRRGFWIKASGKSFREPGFVSCDIDGRPHVDELGSESIKPSMEVGFHSVIYKHSNNMVIAHTHPVNTLKVLCSDRIHDFAEKRLFPDQVVFNGRQSCVVPYTTPGQPLADAIAQKIIELGRCPELFLLQNHGIICCANSVESAVAMTEICEKAAETFLGSSNPRFLTLDEIEDLTSNEDEHYRWRMIRDNQS